MWTKTSVRLRPSTTLRAATPRAAPRNGHTKSCHESMGQPSLTLSSKDEPRGPNQNRSTSASGNGNSEKYHRSSLDQPPRDPGLPERRFRYTLDHPDLALSAYLDDRSRATCADSFQSNCLAIRPLFAWRTNARDFYQVAQTQRTELAVLRGTESRKTQTSRPLRSKTLIIPKRDH